MPTLDLFGLKIALEEETPLPEPDNNNWPLFSEEETPAGFLQWVRQTREAMRRELQANPSLWHCPTHRRHRQILQAMKRCCLWHYYGER